MDKIETIPESDEESERMDSSQKKDISDGEDDDVEIISDDENSDDEYMSTIIDNSKYKYDEKKKDKKNISFNFRKHSLFHKEFCLNNLNYETKKISVSGIKKFKENKNKTIIESDYLIFFDVGSTTGLSTVNTIKSGESTIDNELLRGTKNFEKVEKKKQILEQDYPENKNNLCYKFFLEYFFRYLTKKEKIFKNNKLMFFLIVPPLKNIKNLMKFKNDMNNNDFTIIKEVIQEVFKDSIKFNKSFKSVEEFLKKFENITIDYLLEDLMIGDGEIVISSGGSSTQLTINFKNEDYNYFDITEMFLPGLKIDQLIIENKDFKNLFKLQGITKEKENYYNGEAIDPESFDKVHEFLHNYLEGSFKAFLDGIIALYPKKFPSMVTRSSDIKPTKIVCDSKNGLIFQKIFNKLIENNEVYKRNFIVEPNNQKFIYNIQDKYYNDELMFWDVYYHSNVFFDQSEVDYDNMNIWVKQKKQDNDINDILQPNNYQPTTIWEPCENDTTIKPIVPIRLINHDEIIDIPFSKGNDFEITPIIFEFCKLLKKNEIFDQKIMDFYSNFCGFIKVKPKEEFKKKYSKKFPKINIKDKTVVEKLFYDLFHLIKKMD